MSLMDLIDKARELFGEGGVDSLTEKAGEFSEIAQGDGSLLEKAQEAIEGVDDSAGDLGDASGEPSGGSER
jgi:hypothetical protein